MKFHGTPVVLVGALALFVAACDAAGDDEERAAGPDFVSPVAEPVAVVEFDPLTRDYSLTPEQRTRRSQFDQDAFEEEYSRYREELSRSGQGNEAEAGGMTGSAGSENMSAASTQQSGRSELRPRSEMDFAFLDRNSDDRLSVAEYAIWAIPIDPNKPKPNDQRKPYITADQANKAADSFFYYDTDGSTYLSAEEFAVARTGGSPG